ncbi:MAG: hypothetical protein ACI9FJ_000511 [Alteromonadaceae bacterium]|jgi:hypothetical protein
MCFQTTQMPAMHFAFPDVCKTLVVLAVVPIPYPNIGMTSTSIPTIFNQFTMCMPDHNLLTMTPLSNGDEPGLLMGLISNLIVGPILPLFGSIKVFKTIMPAIKMLSLTGQNGVILNMVGMTLTPSQVKLLICS